ncbi:MAG: tetratricopeptide repeat protein [Acidobacteriaceae bacterium]|nr:tetratricopeptide repeat protein [Acidobacteriaceae bacterium]
MISLNRRPFLRCFLLCLMPLALEAQVNSPAANGFMPRDGSIPEANKPKYPPLTNELRGDIYMARKMYREAIDMYRTGSPDSPVLANKIGIAFHQLMQLDLAKKNYERAIKLDPKYSEAINNLGTIYYSQKSYRRSIGCYKRALRYTHPTASIYANLGAAYFGRKNYKQATEYYEEALKLDPDVFEHHSSFGTLMQERTVEERATYHLYMAKMYAKSGANERAIIYLRKALEEGVKDRDKIPSMTEFAVLVKTPAFLELLAANPKPL